MGKKGNQNEARISEIREIRKNDFTIEDLLKGIDSNDKTALGKAITLVESNHSSHQEAAQELIEKCLGFQREAIRIGITGVPGVGKSTFIETLGKNLTARGKKVAVLAVDPTSTKNKGSILGDKTRMQKLANDPDAFIRPSPAGESLGGVARKTREAIIVCEAAGYDVILVETVGVGQSEVAVHGMVDFFLVLKLSGAGDQLQGIKRGILEMADAVVINKSDGKNVTSAQTAVKEFTRALHLYPPKKNGWMPKVLACSAVENTGVAEIWELIDNYVVAQKESGFLFENRNGQKKEWLLQTIQDLLVSDFYRNDNVKKELKKQIEAVTKGDISPPRAAEKLLRLFQKA